MRQQAPHIAPPSPFLFLPLGLGFIFFGSGVYPFLAWIFSIFGALLIGNLFVSKSPPFIRLFVRWSRALSIETFVALCVLFFFRPLAYFAEKKGKKEGVPILLIHGYLHDRSAWTYLKRALKRKGAIYTINLKPSFVSIEELALQVAEKVKTFKEGHSKIILIGHSMGGLVASWYATKMAPQDLAIDVMTIGSPLKGTYTAKIGFGKNAREMEVGSIFIQTLQKQIQASSHLSFFHIASLADQVIWPQRSALSENLHAKKWVVEDLGHISMLFSPRVAAKLSEWIQ